MTPLLTDADAVGILVLIVLWVSFLTLFGVWLGARISRRRNRR